MGGMTEVNRAAPRGPELSYDPEDPAYDPEQGLCVAPAAGSAGSAGAAGGASSTDGPPSSSPQPPGPGVQALLSRFPTFNNAQRTSGREPTGYADSGVTSTGDTLYAGAAALKGRDPNTGVEVEVFSASGQLGGENELQAGFVRTGISGKNGSLGVEAFTARAAGGAHNDDGSVGINSGAQATAIAVEGTVPVGDGSLTLGASVSVGAAFSFGAKDADGDGRAEFCARLSYGPVTVGACVED